MKIKKAGILTKLVVLIMMVLLATALLDTRGKIIQAQSELEEAQLQLAAQEQVNADLTDAVENSDDPERRKEILHEKWGWVEPGEVDFKFH